MKTTKPNLSEQLLAKAAKEMKRRGATIYRLAKESGCSYAIIYFIMKPEKKAYKRKGAPKFSYEVGKKIENWIESSQAK